MLSKEADIKTCLTTSAKGSSSCEIQKLAISILAFHCVAYQPCSTRTFNPVTWKRVAVLVKFKSSSEVSLAFSILVFNCVAAGPALAHLAL